MSGRLRARYDWWFTWTRGWNWTAWDCQHTSGARLEVKQAAARQSWGTRRSHRATRTSYWTQDENQWADLPERHADLDVFAWREERRAGYADHRDPGQWCFFVVPEQVLPANRQKIGLRYLKALASACRIAELKREIESACPERETLKAVFEHVSS